MPYPNMQNFPGWPISIGGQFSYGLSPNGHAGPSSYVQIAGGGDVLAAQEFGLKFLERVSGGYTSDGLYQVVAINPTNGPVATVALKWIVVATGAEVAAAFNLSASVVNLEAVGLGM